MHKYKREVIRKVFFKMRKDSKCTIKKSKIVKKYKFFKRKFRKVTRNYNNKRVNAKLKSRNKEVKTVGRWNRTATVSFSGLYSTIELSRLIFPFLKL